jgi:NADPH:quinone reductase-like Zn-dependent oxidoreductase
MRAAVVDEAGGPEVLRVRETPTPEPRPGWTLIRVRAFGLNRSEMFTRQGHSPSVTFPRVLGIECVGEVAEQNGVADGFGALPPGTRVAAAMGGMGRAFDGGYAEYTLVPTTQVMPVRTNLDWAVFGALPETYLTAWGSLRTLGDGHSLLVRGGTSSVGMAAIALAKANGTEVAATTRNPAKADRLRAIGADHVVIEGDDLPAAVRAVWPDGAELVLDLVGGVKLLDSLRSATAPGGTVCNTGILGDSWTIPDFEPISMIPSGVKLTVFSSNQVANAALWTKPLQWIADDVEQGRYAPNIDRVFALDDIAEAHHYMETNQATGKLVVTP